MFSRLVSRVPRSNLVIRSFSSSASEGPLHKTALYEDHVKLGGKMVPFAGYSLPVQYKDSIINSHLHCRNSASIFDVSHMGQLRIHGKKGVEFLESITVADIGALKTNQARLSSLMTEEGGMIDDCMITKKDGYIYMVINAGCKEKDLKHMNEQLQIFNKKNASDVSIELLTSHELLALQGPKAAAALEKLLGKDNPSFDLSKFPFMFNTELKIGGITCGVSRSGYTGEDGFEISVPRQSVSKLLYSFLENPSVLAAGLGVRDSLRLEAGLCLYGHEMNESISPIEAGLAWTITKRRREQGGFPGHSVMMKQLKEGVSRKRIGLAMLKGPPARENCDIVNNAGQKIGFVTSGTFSPSLNKGIAMGYVSTNEAKEGNQLKAVIRGKPYEAEIVKMPFVPTRYFKVA